jgi:para-nitrobenzyl esterase
MEDAMSSKNVVKTTYGPVQGTEENGLQVFRGIPYAKPPVGELRWKPPQPPDSWTDTLVADKIGFTCPQPEDILETASKYPQSEDCLTLNVWTPGADDARRPVMVWIHGGSYVYGGTSDPLYYADNIARRGDVVCITINYRLGIFGMLYLGDVGGPGYEKSANHGMLDQELALKWVKANAEAFGGDPDNITIFGESAGGISIAALLGMPSANGLFHKAVPQSNGSVFRAFEFAKETTNQIMQFAGVGDIEGLNKLSQQELVDLELNFIESYPLTAEYFFMPCVDGNVLPEPTVQAILNGRANDVPLLTGSMPHEITYWDFYLPMIKEMTAEDLIEGNHWFKEFLDRHFEDYRRDVVESYSSRRTAGTPNDALIAIMTDTAFRLPLIRITEAYEKASRSPVYMYLFTWESQANDYLRACHAIELPFLFRNFDNEFTEMIVGPNPPMELADIVQDAWIAFARTGNPSHAGNPKWPAYNTDKRATMILNTPPEVVNDPHGDDRKVWDGIPFDGTDPTASWPDQ